jgi:hypothetical protein
MTLKARLADTINAAANHRVPQSSGGVRRIEP